MTAMYTCKEATQLALEKHERHLSWRERLGLRIHYLICDACARFAQQMQFLRQTARRYGERHQAEEQDTVLTPEAKKRIRAKLHET
jgi:hypothetical protein